MAVQSPRVEICGGKRSYQRLNGRVEPYSVQVLGALPPFKHGRDDAAAMLKGLLARMRCVLHACF
eukprot:8112491-Pyramimonas_sp.AAC.1